MLVVGGGAFIAATTVHATNKARDGGAEVGVAAARSGAIWALLNAQMAGQDPQHAQRVVAQWRRGAWATANALYRAQYQSDHHLRLVARRKSVSLGRSPPKLRPRSQRQN